LRKKLRPDLNVGNACCICVQSLLSLSCLKTKIKIKPFCMGVKLGLPLKERTLRRIFERRTGSNRGMEELNNEEFHNTRVYPKVSGLSR
jgi:hypothetical protein